MRLPGNRKACWFVAAAAVLLAAGVTAGDSAAPAKARPRVDVVFCLDTTGSMGGLIAAAQQKVWSIVNGIASGQPVPEVRVGLVAFRDRSDAYITKITDLTADLDAVHQALFALKAEGGGDTPESVNQALSDAVRKISWTPKEQKAYRVIFLVGDSPPHMDYTDDVKYPETCQEAVKKDIIVNTIRCGNIPGTEQHWLAIAKGSEGSSTSIAQDGGVQVVATPLDAELAELSGKLVGTGVYRGAGAKRMEFEAKQRAAVRKADTAKESKDTAMLAIEADKSAFRGKAAAATAAPAAPASDAAAGMGMGEEVGRADLVASFARDGEKALAGVKKEMLPDEMQKMSPEEQKAFLEKKTAERKEIQTKIDELSKKRTAFIQEELKKRGVEKGFDSFVLKTLQEQGAKKGIEYPEGK